MNSKNDWSDRRFNAMARLLGEFSDPLPDLHAPF